MKTLLRNRGDCPLHKATMLHLQVRLGLPDTAVNAGFTLNAGRSESSADRRPPRQGRRRWRM